MRFHPLLAIALAVSVTGAPCFATGDTSSDAPDLSIGTLINEGKNLATQAKSADDALKQLDAEDAKSQKAKVDWPNDNADYTKTKADLEANCSHQFVQGQEEDVKSCNDKYEHGVQVSKKIQSEQGEAQAQGDWKARKANADQQKADVELKIKSWNYRMKAFMVAKELSSCSNAVAASAGSSDSYAETLRLVSGYQKCWDAARSHRALPDSAVTQGSPVFSSRPARTPEQAVEDYKNSGNPTAAPPLQRGLDKGNVPPAPSSSGP